MNQQVLTSLKHRDECRGIEACKQHILAPPGVGSIFAGLVRVTDDRAVDLLGRLTERGDSRGVASTLEPLIQRRRQKRGTSAIAGRGRVFRQLRSGCELRKEW